MKLWLAPLEGVSDCAFRTLCYRYGADMTFTPMIRVDALVRGNKATMQLLDLHNDTPTGIQLLAVKPATLQQFVKEFKDSGMNPVSFDLNCGCPSPDVIRGGGGAALIKRTKRLNELITILNRLGKPVSIKMRLGLNSYEKEKKVYLHVLKEVEADHFIIHARHARQTSREPADWKVFEECVATGKHIIPNGDIGTKQDIDFFRRLGIKEVMIGRAAVRNPCVFNWLKGDEQVAMKDIRKTYGTLSAKYHSQPSFKKTVLDYMGKEIHSKAWLM